MMDGSFCFCDARTGERNIRAFTNEFGQQLGPQSGKGGVLQSGRQKGRMMLNETADARFREPEILFFGIGGQKCGTNWLHDFLKQHEDACVPQGKELHYWNALGGDVEKIIEGLSKAGAKAAGNRSGRSYGQRIKMLRNRDAAHTSYTDVLFRHYTGQKAAGEITPDYARLPEEVFAQMAALNADTRFVLLMRDPVDRLHSAMRKQLRSRVNGDRTAVIPGDAVLAEFKDVLTEKKEAPIQRSSYDQTIRALENVVDRSKIGLFFYEDIFGSRNADPICDFLSIACKPGNFDHVANPGNPVSDDRASEFRKLAMSRLAPTYEYMDARFGAALPAAWRRGERA